MKLTTPYPGKRIDDETGIRLLRAFVYKFSRERNVTLKKIFDKKSRQFTEKKFLHIRITPPFWGRKFKLSNRTDRSILFDEFFLDKKEVFFMPHYRFDISDKRKTNIYCSTPTQIITYFESQKPEESQNIYMFDSSFSWFIDVFSEPREGAVNDKDYIFLFFHKSFLTDQKRINKLEGSH